MSDEQQPPVPEDQAQQHAAGQQTAPAEAATAEEALQAEIAALKDHLLREQAEMQNVRRRAERDVEQARKFALDRFAADLLPVMDNFERALQAADDSNEALKPVLEGIELTRRQLADVFQRHQITAIDPKGQPFDPALHEAVATVPAPGAEPNTVLDVMQKGYTLNGRVIRAAMVVVVAASQ
ncbi:MAG: nucleotide exchange factor GrpE [Gammaproteobacteria bacterium]|nr:MAG: nucleotide exchange factor GrpE [Gammaproteobacteria bacterium]